MTVERRILDQNFNVISRREIKPGKKLRTRAKVIEKEHPHKEFIIIFHAKCAGDDSKGRLSFLHPEAGLVKVEFMGDQKPFYMVRRRNGSLGLIEWEHVLPK